MFESYVILNTTKTKNLQVEILYQFESYVILNTTKTYNLHLCLYLQFESYVILNTTKTAVLKELNVMRFESYVILNCVCVWFLNNSKAHPFRVCFFRKQLLEKKLLIRYNVGINVKENLL